MSQDIVHQAFALLVDVVAGLDDADWERRSNLDDWTVRDVVAHVTGSVAKVRALALDEPVEQLRSDPADWHAADPVASLRTACAQAESALDGADLDSPRTMRGTSMPLGAAIAFPVVDAAVHAWDIRHSLGRDLELPPAFVDYATTLTDRVGDAPNPNFAPPVTPAPGATPTQRLMNRLGRTTG